MSSHLDALRILASEQSPLGVAARKVLEDLAAARKEIARLEALLREYRARVTLGGPPPKPAMPDYRHLRKGAM